LNWRLKELVLLLSGLNTFFECSTSLRCCD